MLLKKNIKLLSWFNFCTDFVFFAPVAVIYFAKVTGSVTLGMSIFSVAYISAALFEVPTGIISDLVGRKKTIVLGAICSVLCVVLYALGNGFLVLFIGAVFQGMSRSFYSGNNDALLHDTLRESGQENEYHSYLGRTSSVFQIALAVASLMGGFMAFWSFNLVMWASVVPQVCALLIALQFVEPNIRQKYDNTNVFAHLRGAITQSKQNYKLRMLTMASVIRFALGESSYFLRSAFVAMLWPVWAIGISQMASNIFGALSYYFSGKIIDKYSPLRVLNVEIISNRIINLIALIYPTPASPLIMSATSLTYGAGSVATNSLLQKEFTAKQRATMSSLDSLAGSLVFGLFAILLGAIADMTSVAIALVIANLILLTPLFFYRKVFMHDRTSGLISSK